MNEPFFVVPTGGVVIPWPELMGTNPTTWFVKLGHFPDTEKVFLKTGIQAQVPWAEEHWLALHGRLESANGPSTRVDRAVHGGPVTIRGTMDPGAALRVDIVYGTGFDIPIHAQLGNSAYVGIISTNLQNNFIIQEEMTFEDLINP